MTFRGTSIGSKAELGALAGREGQPMGGWSQGIGQASNPVGDLPLALGGSAARMCPVPRLELPALRAARMAARREGSYEPGRCLCPAQGGIRVHHGNALISRRLEYYRQRLGPPGKAKRPASRSQHGAQGRPKDQMSHQRTRVSPSLAAGVSSSAAASRLLQSFKVTGKPLARNPAVPGIRPPRSQASMRRSRSGSAGHAPARAGPAVQPASPLPTGWRH
jgi:hypothetical protein